jgi:hypothetical protein
LRADDFDLFFVARSEALLDLVAAAMGKAPVRDEASPEAAEIASALNDEPDEPDDNIEPGDTGV